MSVKKLFSTAICLIALCSCQSNHEPSVFIPDKGEIQLNMLYPGESTRVTDLGFEATDSIGVYVTANDAILQLAGNEVNNELFTFNGTSWTSSRKVYWNEGLHNVYAYYPYSSYVNDVLNYNFDVKLDQSSTEAYSQSDFLWASVSDVEASDKPIQMQFEHKMSKVVVELVKGEKFEGNIPSDAEVYIHGTVPNAVIDLATGDVAKNSFGGVKTIKCKKIADNKYSAIVVPQSLLSKQPIVEIIVDNVSYLMDGKISFHQGYMHTLTVTLNQNPEQIKIEIGGDIDGWE